MTSMRLTIFILIVLACAAILIILFQNYHPTNFYGWEEFYRTHTHPVKYALYQFFQLFTPYNSWWFISLLAILCVSLLLCSIERFGIIMRLLAENDDFRTEDNLSLQENFHTLKMPAELSVPLTIQTLRHKLYTVFTRTDSGKTLLFARKHSTSRLGPFLSHIGLLFLFAGGLIASLLGRSTLLWGGPGEYVQAPFADHRLLVNDFTIQYNREGRVKDYLSTVELFDSEGKHVLDRKIEVNGPLRYKGVSYYQSSYRLHSRKAKSITLAISDSSGSAIDTLTVEFASKRVIPGTGYEIEFAAFAADFQITEEGVISKSDKLNNPAFLIQFLRSGEETGHQWLFARFPDAHMNEGNPFTVSFMTFEPYYYTGLQASRNPGSPFIWAGFIIMTLGLILVFYFNHRVFWAVFVHNPGKRDEIYIAGNCHKFKEQYKREMNEIVSKIKSRAKIDARPRASGNAHSN